MSPSGEEQLVRWLQRRTGGPSSPIGDDAALLQFATGNVATTADQQIEGVHFVPKTDPSIVGRRLAAINLSDLAAVGAQATHAVVTVAAPTDFDHRRFFEGTLKGLEAAGAELVGGDLAKNRVVNCAMTLWGVGGPRHRWLLRSNARPGDQLWLGGVIGRSALGRTLVEGGARRAGGRIVDLPPAVPPELQKVARRAVRCHLLPEPQLQLSRWLARRRRAAAIDVSDGVALDLHRLCRASHVGAHLEAEALPIDPEDRSLAHALGEEMNALALGGGEDYVLLFALPPTLRPPKELGCQPVGFCCKSHAVEIRRDGHTRSLPATGWDHLRPAR